MFPGPTCIAGAARRGWSLPRHARALDFLADGAERRDLGQEGIEDARVEVAGVLVAQQVEDLAARSRSAGPQRLAAAELLEEGRQIELDEATARALDPLAEPQGQR